MSSYTEENLLGGLAPDKNGKMVFQRAGIGAYLVEDNNQKQGKQK